MKLIKRLKSLFYPKQVESDLAGELEFHLEMETQSLVREGMQPTEARQAALRNFGNMASIQEEVRDTWGSRLLNEIRQDVGYGIRGLGRNPGFSFVVILTLALGIGANTAIFTVVQGVLLRPLPFVRPDRVVSLNQAAPRAGQPFLGFSVPDFMDFRARNRSFSALAEYHSMWFILLGRSEPERVQTGVVSDNYFDLLGVTPLLGRTFLPAEDRPGAAPVLVLSYEYWQRSFGGDPHVVGQVFEMNNKPHTVVGVLPPLPAFPNSDQIFMPASACPFRGAERVLTNRQGRIISNVFGRLKDGVNSTQSLDDLHRVGVELCGSYPQDYPADDGYTVEQQSITNAFTGNARVPLLVLLAMSGFVLLISCANVANLAWARLLRRDRELAIRTALGAGKWRIFRQLLIENLLVSLLGALAGLALAAIGIRLLVDFASRFLPRADEIAINTPVLFFTLVISVLTGLIVGCRPFIPVSSKLIGILKDGSRGSAGGQDRLRGMLVIGQIAIAVPLLMGAGLATRSLLKLEHVDPGIQSNRVLAANLNLNWSKYDDAPKSYGFWERAMTEAAKIASVQEVAFSGVEPLNGVANSPTPFRIDGRTLQPGASTPAATVTVASEGYFKVVGQQVLHGRTFLQTDAANSPGVAVINQSLASKLWPMDEPVGHRISFDNGTTWNTIVGVVTNARQQINVETVDEITVPLRQAGRIISGTLLLRTEAAPAVLIREFREAIRSADPLQPVTRIETIETVRNNALAAPKLIATLLALFALLALAITSAGIGGVLAFTVSMRTQEIGIRMALGASRWSVLKMVLRQGLGLVAIGMAIGVLASIFLSKLMSDVLYRIPPNDPLTIVAVICVLVLVATVACLVPAGRATKIDPIRALRAS